ncbi:cytochrome P450 [Hygrophoropsis aurantiaca]|uniref:Cytochrome P450 n=1 Tax=Hygrophoropsis aurantiaca TaxID=72124 RepID=A0ACB8AKT0_9AGAM|nr:cytochrome P450 [Hygrophoropsis aurantiaca]
MQNTILIAVILGILAASVTRYFTQYRGKTASLSQLPGPVPLPILGNVLSINSKAPWMTFRKWGAAYGGILKFRMFTSEIIIINSLEYAKDLLVLRSSNYSSRPTAFYNEITGADWNSVLFVHGDLWRLHRRILHQSFRSDAVAKYRPKQLEKAHQLLFNVLNNPENFKDHLFQFSSSAILSALYDYDVAVGDPLIRTVEKWNQLALTLMTPQADAINRLFPFLMYIPSWFPGMPPKRKAVVLGEYKSIWMETPFKHATKKIAEGTAHPSMVYELQEHISRSDDTESMRNAGTAFFAASETSASVLHVFILAMVLYPDVQARAREAIDSVVGTTRLPTFEDRSSLPYLDAIMRETLRWNPIAPLGVAHVTERDDVYQGYHIPKGSTIYPNIWAMTHDETMYPNPFEFQPERFLTADGELTDDTVNVVFGFGRRVCVGRYFADASVWIAITLLLATFEFQKPVDPNGQDVDVVPEFTSGITSQPVPFSCRIVSRIPGMNTDKLMHMLDARA